MTALRDMIAHPRVTLDAMGWPHRIYSGIDWSEAQSDARHRGEHLFWRCTMCKETHHGARAWAIAHAKTHGRVWDADSQCLLTPEAAA